MTSRDFCYWLQGFLELSEKNEISPRQVEIIRNHLNMVFVHEIDSSIPDPEGVLQQIHDGKPTFWGGSPGIMKC